MFISSGSSLGLSRYLSKILLRAGRAGFDAPLELLKYLQDRYCQQKLKHNEDRSTIRRKLAIVTAIEVLLQYPIPNAGGFDVTLSLDRI